ncbi:MAG: transglycosylase domain-containing protein [Actinomycetota bacterium]|nr:transglycosylase domain-containing protein [Actinomycetota bacterium]
MSQPKSRRRSAAGFVQQLAVLLGVSVLSGVLLAGMAIPFAGLAGLGARDAKRMVEELPMELETTPPAERTRILTGQGKLLATLYDQNRVELASLDDVSPMMRRAIVAIEDFRFYEHGALDVKGTIRALIANQASGATVQGGSSITQQLVKMTLLEQADTEEERAAATADTYGRKLTELRYALAIEETRSKDEILLDYLNIAYFGDGAYGIEAAAQNYFSTSADELRLRQAALLSGIVKNPTGYDPTNNPQGAKQRRNVVLNRMAQLGEISERTARKASRRSLGLQPDPTPNGCVASDAEFFCDYVRAWLVRQPALGETVEDRQRLLDRGGLTIRTTLDPRFQRAAERGVRQTVGATDRVVGALAMVEPGTGEVRAIAQSRPMGGNKNRGQTFVNYLVPSKYTNSAGFQPGSTFKAFVLAAAIKQGIPLNTEISSPPKLRLKQDSFTTCDGAYPVSRAWKPKNSTSSGMMNLYTGTRLSVNTFFARLEQRTGLCEPWRIANAVGLKLPETAMVPTFTLGVSSVSPLGMAEAYATFAARGMHCEAIPVTQVLDRNGNEIAVAGPSCRRVLPAAVADAVNDVLQGVIAEPEGFAYEYNLDQPAAGKTGTTQNAQSVWFMGYTPNLATASMLAGVNRKGQPASLIGKSLLGQTLTDASGSGTAAPMWYAAMNVVQRWLPDDRFVEPDPTVIRGRPVTVPALAGTDPTVAARRLRDVGLNAVILYNSPVDSAYRAGTVADTNPGASTPSFSGQSVLIYISDGTPYVAPKPEAPPTFTIPAPEPPSVPTPEPEPPSVPTPEPAPTPEPPSDGGAFGRGDGAGGDGRGGNGDDSPGPDDGPGHGNGPPPGRGLGND